jgi:hypothetical protein
MHLDKASKTDSSLLGCDTILLGSNSQCFIGSQCFHLLAQRAVQEHSSWTAVRFSNLTELIMHGKHLTHQYI